MSGLPPAQSAGNSSFALRILKVVVNTADGSSYTFDGSPLSWVPFVPGLAIECDIEQVLLPQLGGPIFIRVHGMTLNEINALSVAGTLWKYTARNTVSVYAGGTTGPGGDLAMTALVINGPIVEARPEFNNMPDVAFFIHALPGLSVQMNNTVTPTSFKGATSFDTVAQAIAQKVGKTYSGNNTGSHVLNNPYFSGSAHDQFVEAVHAYKLRGAYDSSGNLVAFAQDGFIPGAVATISAENGMIGYPDFQAVNVRVRTIFDPAIADIVSGPGHQVQIVSQLTAATGIFVVSHMSYALSCNMESGSWEIVISASLSDVSPSGE